MELKRIFDWWFSRGARKLVNWWNYHVWHVVCGLAGIIVGLSIAALRMK